MDVYFLISLALLPFVMPTDPAPGLSRTRTASRALDCERMSTAALDRRSPGEVRPTSPRGDYVERSAMVCTERLMRPGLRSDLDEAVLSTLDDRASELAMVTGALSPELTARTWLVETHFPSAPVSTKISFATKNALVAQGLTVSDRAPALGTGDIEVITRMAPALAWPAACRRYHDNGSLGADEALLAVVTRDRRDTALHAGVCVGGQWAWLQ